MLTRMKHQSKSKRNARKQGHKDDHTDSTLINSNRDTESHHSEESTTEGFGRRKVNSEFEENAIRCFRYFILVLILAVTASAVVLSYKYLKDQQDISFALEVSLPSFGFDGQ